MPDKTAELDPQSLEAARAYLWHARNRSACHNAKRDRCECSCGGDLHKGAGIGSLDIPPEVLAQLRAEVAPEHKPTRCPGPRRVKRNAAQLRMLLA